MTLRTRFLVTTHYRHAGASASQYFYFYFVLFPYLFSSSHHKLLVKAIGYALNLSPLRTDDFKAAKASKPICATYRADIIVRRTVQKWVRQSNVICKLPKIFHNVLSRELQAPPSYSCWVTWTSAKQSTFVLCLEPSSEKMQGAKSLVAEGRLDYKRHPHDFSALIRSLNISGEEYIQQVGDPVTNLNRRTEDDVCVLHECY